MGEAIVRDFETNGHAATTEYPYQPVEWQEPFRSRRRSFGQSPYLDHLGIAPADTAGRHAHHIRNYDFFGAPVGLVLTVSYHPLASMLTDNGGDDAGEMPVAQVQGPIASVTPDGAYDNDAVY